MLKHKQKTDPTKLAPLSGTFWKSIFDYSTQAAKGQGELGNAQNEVNKLIGGGEKGLLGNRKFMSMYVGRRSVDLGVPLPSGYGQAPSPTVEKNNTVAKKTVSGITSQRGSGKKKSFLTGDLVPKTTKKKVLG